MKGWLSSASAVPCVSVWPEKLWRRPALLTKNRCSAEERCLFEVSIESKCFVTLLFATLLLYSRSVVTERVCVCVVFTGQRISRSGTWVCLCMDECECVCVSSQATKQKLLHLDEVESLWFLREKKLFFLG